MTRRGTLHVRGGATACTSDLAAVERRAIGTAGRGQLGLELTILPHEILGVGAFHRVPASVEARSGIAGVPTIHRRRCGGRVMALGPDVALLTLALPHRSALTAVDRGALRPEQVLNRAVRGVLAALRALGLDPTYPGLDLVTIGRQIVAQASFAELHDGITLMQFALAIRQPLSRAMALLDRLDPDGVVAAAPIGEPACATWASLVRADRAGVLDDPPELTRLLAHGFARAFDLEIVEAIEAMDSPQADDCEAARADAPTAPPPEPHGDDAVLRRSIRTGVVEAWARSTGGYIASAGILGDVLAPPATLQRLATALAGRPATRLGIATAAATVLDGHDDYVLGISPDELIDVVAAAGGIA